MLLGSAAVHDVFHAEKERKEVSCLAACIDRERKDGKKKNGSQPVCTVLYVCTMKVLGFFSRTESLESAMHH